MRTRFSLPTLMIVLLAAWHAFADDTAVVSGYRGDDNRVAAVFNDLGNGVITPPKALERLTKLPSSLRFDGSKTGDLVRIYSFYYKDGDKGAEVLAREKKRDLFITGQLDTLKKIIVAIGAGAVAGKEVKVDIYDHKLELNRAELTASSEIKDNPQEQSHDISVPPPAQWVVVFDFTDNGDRAANAKKTEATILTGSREAWSLSADVPLRSLGDVKVDSEGKNVDLKNTPDAFYVGLNYAFTGDVLRPPNNPLEAVTLKFLLKASRRPSDSFGIGLGLRDGALQNLPSFFQIFETISPYAAYTRTRVEQDKTNTDGTTSKIHFKRSEFVIGLSLKLDKALDFLKGSGDK